jgi:hypothetical protein
MFGCHDQYLTDSQITPVREKKPAARDPDFFFEEEIDNSSCIDFSEKKKKTATRKHSMESINNEIE